MSFFRRNRDRIIVITIAIILITLIAVTNGERKSITKVEKLVGNLLSPLNKVSSKLSHSLSEKYNSVKDVFTLKEENEKLKEKVIELEDKNRKYENIIGQNDYLKDQKKLLENTNYSMISSNVIGKGPENWFDVFTIDKGSKDGITRGDIVVQGVEIEKGFVVEGLVGKVTDVGDKSAKVITIVDELSSIAFKTLRTQDGGIISGNKDSEITGYLFDENANVIKGDRLYTSGIGGTFYKDLYIGEVGEIISEDDDMMKGIKVVPAIDFKKIYHVYILK